MRCPRCKQPFSASEDAAYKTTSIGAMWECEFCQMRFRKFPALRTPAICAFATAGVLIALGWFVTIEVKQSRQDEAAREEVARYFNAEFNPNDLGETQDWFRGLLWRVNLSGVNLDNAKNMTDVHSWLDEQVAALDGQQVNWKFTVSDFLYSPSEVSEYVINWEWTDQPLSMHAPFRVIEHPHWDYDAMRRRLTLGEAETQDAVRYGDYSALYIPPEFIRQIIPGSVVTLSAKLHVSRSGYLHLHESVVTQVE